MPSTFNFSSKNFKEFCEENNLEKNEARNIVFSEINRVLTEIKQLEGNNE